MDNKEDRDVGNSLKVYFTKIGKYLLIIVAPIIFIMLAITPIVMYKTGKSRLEQYKLPKDFDRKDVIFVVSNMRKNHELEFYFQTLNTHLLNKASEEAAQILENNRNKQGLLNQIGKMKEKVKSLSIFFESLELPDDFKEYPEHYPELHKIMYQFIYEEFKLTILGLCYKATFDPDFSFQWDVDARLSAEKIRNIILKLQLR